MLHSSLCIVLGTDQNNGFWWYVQAKCFMSGGLLEMFIFSNLPIPEIFNSACCAKMWTDPGEKSQEILEFIGCLTDWSKSVDASLSCPAVSHRAQTRGLTHHQYYRKTAIGVLDEIGPWPWIPFRDVRTPSLCAQNFWFNQGWRDRLGLIDYL